MQHSLLSLYQHAGTGAVYQNLLFLYFSFSVILAGSEGLRVQSTGIWSLLNAMSSLIVVAACLEGLSMVLQHLPSSIAKKFYMIRHLHFLEY